MSRGPGRIERAVGAAFEANPSRTFTVAELAAVAYPDAPAIEKRHRVAVIRAADRVSWRLDWTAMRSKMARPGLVYFRQGDARAADEARTRAGEA